MKTEFASIKLARPFVAWLKREAARRGVPMYELVEVLVAKAGVVRPWQIIPSGDRLPVAELNERE
jgi:hypothetical protein